MHCALRRIWQRIRQRDPSRRRTRPSGRRSRKRKSIVKVLVRSKFLTGVRGKGDGYRSTRPPEQYTAGRILRLTEGSLAPAACLDREPVPCPRMAGCRTLPMWRKLNALMQDFFSGIALADPMASGQSGGGYVI